MESETKILKTVEKDYEAIAEIYKEAFNEPPFNEEWTKEKCLDQLNRFSKYCDIYTLFLKEEIIGFVIMNPNYWFPGKYVFGEEAAIKLEYRGKGYGKYMIEETLKKYKEKGFIKYLGINNIEAGAYNFWKKLGAKETTQDKLTEIKLNDE